MAPGSKLLTADAAEIAADLRREIELLRQGLWDCYALAGGDPDNYTTDEVSSEDLVPLVLDCVRDLRGLFDAARRDLR